MSQILNACKYIRRGTLLPEDADIDILLSYKNEYIERYERISDDKKDDVVKEFLEIIKIFDK